MNMHLVDWSIVVGLMVMLIWAAHRTKKYTRSVADFLAANRCAGRYLLGVSDSMAGIGAISIVAWFEAYYQTGFTFAWWHLTFLLVMLITSLSGWVQYRYRQTRAMTMAQFLEMRYSKRFRVFAGIIAFVSGTLNFGIFPAVGSRFFIYFCGLPSYEIPLFGEFTIDLTYVLVMAILLTFSLYFTFSGGQIAVIITDFIQGTFANIILVIIIAVVFVKFPWSQFVDVLSQQPPGKSMLDPLDTGEIGVFDKWYYIIYAFGIWWTWLAWQGQQGSYVSARNPHEARMGRVLGSWRMLVLQLLVMILPICAFVLMHHTDWSATAGNANEILNSVSTDPGDAIRKQVTVTVVLTQFLTPGLLGGFCAVMLAAFISTHNAYLHSWGSLFIQDVILPFRKKQLSTKKHMNLLRCSIFGVAMFIFLFSIFFAQYDFILMFFALTGTIWLGGGGTVIVGGLYWKRGTTAGAYGALTIGIVTFTIGFIMQKTWPLYHSGATFPISSQWLWFIAMMSSIVIYVLLSLLGKRSVCDMDKLLHRGKYAVADDTIVLSDKQVPAWQRLLGVTREFTTKDKILYFAILGWTVIWGVIFFVVTIYNLIFDVEIESWAKFWHFYVWLALILGIVTIVWFTVGGLFNLKEMLQRLTTMNRDNQDDGTVAENNNQSQ